MVRKLLQHGALLVEDGTLEPGGQAAAVLAQVCIFPGQMRMSRNMKGPLHSLHMQVPRSGCSLNARTNVLPSCCFCGLRAPAANPWQRCGLLLASRASGTQCLWRRLVTRVTAAAAAICTRLQAAEPLTLPGDTPRHANGCATNEGTCRHRCCANLQMNSNEFK